MARTQVNANEEILWPSWASGAVLLGAGAGVTPTTVAPGASGNVLTSNGSIWVSQAPTGGGSDIETVTVTSTATLTLSTSSSSITDYVYTGAVAATWTLPPVAGNAGKRINIENAGTAAAAVITLNRAGTDNIWFLNTLTSILIAQGGSMLLLCDGTYWQVLSTDLSHDAIGVLPVANGGAGPSAALTAAVSCGTSQTKVLSLQIPANSLAVGSTFEILVNSIQGASISSIATGQIHFGVNNTTADAVVSSIAAKAASAVSTGIYLHAILTVWSIGAAGTAIANGVIAYATSTTAGAAYPSATSATTAINTTVANFVSVSLAVASGTLSAETAMIRQVV